MAVMQQGLHSCDSRVAMLLLPPHRSALHPHPPSPARWQSCTATWRWCSAWCLRWRACRPTCWSSCCSACRAPSSCLSACASLDTCADWPPSRVRAACARAVASRCAVGGQVSFKKAAGRAARMQLPSVVSCPPFSAPCPSCLQSRSCGGRSCSGARPGLQGSLPSWTTPGTLWDVGCSALAKPILLAGALGWPTWWTPAAGTRRLLRWLLNASLPVTSHPSAARTSSSSA